MRQGVPGWGYELPHVNKLNIKVGPGQYIFRWVTIIFGLYIAWHIIFS